MPINKSMLLLYNYCSVHAHDPYQATIKFIDNICDTLMTVATRFSMPTCT